MGMLAKLFPSVIYFLPCIKSYCSDDLRDFALKETVGIALYTVHIHTNCCWWTRWHIELWSPSL